MSKPIKVLRDDHPVKFFSQTLSNDKLLVDDEKAKEIIRKTLMESCVPHMEDSVMYSFEFDVRPSMFGNDSTTYELKMFKFDIVGYETDEEGESK